MVCKSDALAGKGFVCCVLDLQNKTFRMRLVASRSIATLTGLTPLFVIASYAPTDLDTDMNRKTYIH